MAKLNPPRLTKGPVSGSIFIVTHGKVTGHDADGREMITASVKYDVSDQFMTLALEIGEELSLD